MAATIRIARPSVMSLLLGLRFNGTELAVATGFVAPSPIGPVLITARHNVTGRRQDNGQLISKNGGVPNEVVIVHNAKGGVPQWVPITEPLYSVGLPKWREHPTLGPRADFVALPLSNTSGIDLHLYDPATPGQDMALGPGDIVSVIGFPFGMQAGGSLAIWATGFLASEPSIDYNQMPQVLIDCRSRPGQSGSAVIAYRGQGTPVGMMDGRTVMHDAGIWRLIGIYSGRINAESDLGIIWKASAIAELIASLK